MIGCGVDIGSNTVRILIAEVSNGKIGKVLYSDRGITRLADGIYKEGLLLDKNISATISLLKTFKSKIDELDVKNILAVATSAVREAANAKVFLDKALAIGFDIQVITGQQEAYYTYTGVCAAKTNYANDNIILFDIGGGSTEVSIIINNKIKYTKSFELGVVKLSEKFGFDKPSDSDKHNQCFEFILENLSDLSKIISDFSGTKLIAVGTAGTVTTVAAVDLKLENYSSEVISRHKLTMEKLDIIVNNLSYMNSEEKLLVPGISKGREDLIIPGILITKAILHIFKLNYLCISDYGLREGLTVASTH